METSSSTSENATPPTNVTAWGDNHSDDGDAVLTADDVWGTARAAVVSLINRAGESDPSTPQPPRVHITTTALGDLALLHLDDLYERLGEEENLACNLMLFCESLGGTPESFRSYLMDPDT